MLKQPTYNIADSNIAMLGSDLEKQVKKAAADKEPAWENAGKAVGLDIWRIEKFKVVPWPKDQYGSFFAGDSYIVLHTYKKPGKDALLWNVHFWLGDKTTQDEAGTAAYKTVELDDKLGGGPVQFREAMGHESQEFLHLFEHGVKIMEGGIETGFKHVEATKYRPRLLHVKGTKKTVCIKEVDLLTKSLNEGDVFILDLGMKLYQWIGKAAGMFEKNKAATFCRHVDDERKSAVEIIVCNQGQDSDFPWDVLGGRGTIAPATPDDVPAGTKKLLKVSDASGKLEMTEVASGAAIKRELLDEDDVFILDAVAQVYVWVGKGANANERKNALGFAQSYLTANNRPAYLPIVRILSGGDNQTFEHEMK